MKKIRIDALLVELGLAESREKAQRIVRAGQATANGARIDKPGAMVDRAAAIRVSPLGGMRFVSRGGDKLQAALDAFGLSPAGLVCLDLGASTGGFTDCLLQAGALRVHAIDVGRNQLHERLRADPRVISREQTNAREIGPETLGELAEFCAADLSFISLLKVVPAAAPLLAPGAILVALIKPQFEAGREWVRRGGRVLDPEAHRLVLRRVLGGLAEIGFAFQGLILSPLRGPAGNWEYLACLRKTPDGRPAPPAPEDSIAAAMRGAFDAGTEE